MEPRTPAHPGKRDRLGFRETKAEPRISAPGFPLESVTPKDEYEQEYTRPAPTPPAASPPPGPFY